MIYSKKTVIRGESYNCAQHELPETKAIEYRFKLLSLLSSRIEMEQYKQEYLGFRKLCSVSRNRPE